MPFEEVRRPDEVLRPFARAQKLNGAFMQQRGLTPIAPTVQRMAAGTAGEEVAEIATNLFAAAVKPSRVFRYRVEIEGFCSFGSERHAFDFTGPVGGDYNVVERRLACLAVFLGVVQENAAVFVDREALFYDQCSMLFSMQELQLAASGGQSQTFELSAAKIPNHDDPYVRKQLHGKTSFLLKVMAVGEALSTDISARCRTTDLEQLGGEITQFVDVASLQTVNGDTNNFVSFSKGLSYVFEPHSFGYQKADVPPLNTSMYVGIGTAKSSRFIKNEGEGGMAIAVEPRITPFHQFDQKLTDKAREKLERGALHELAKSLRGLVVQPEHLANRPDRPRVLGVTILRLGEPANRQTFVPADGEPPITVADYFRQQHGIHLKHPDYPVVIAKHGGQQQFYPMELLSVYDNQRVKSHQLDARTSAEMLKMAAVKPAELQQRIQRGARMLGLVDSKFLQKANISVAARPMTVRGRWLNAPQLVFARGRRQEYDGFEGRWRMDAFVQPATPPAIWAMYAFRSPSARDLNEAALTQMCQAFGDECHRRGLLLPVPAEMLIVEEDGLKSRIDAFLEYLQAAVKADCEFVLVLTPKEDKEIHSFLKAYELRHPLITQNVTLPVMWGAAGVGDGRPKRDTLGNIVCKTNVKLGGLNYEVVSGDEAVGKHDLVLGLALNVAGGGGADENSPPSILGFAANDTKNCGAFVGDYVFQPAALNGHLSSMDQAGARVFKRYLAARDGRPPRRVVVYRNGCSEGQFAQVVSNEVPLFRRLIDEHFGGHSQLVLLVVNKVHSVRLMPAEPDPRAPAARQNLRPGVVVDRQIVDPAWPEFFLNAHNTLLGTAKVPRYSVLANDAGVGMDELQRLTLDLCFAHQIVNCPVSKPAPSYVAEEYAKRGRNNLLAQMNRNLVHQITNHYGDEEQRTVVLTNEIGLEQHAYRNNRLNA
ncbi:hypothetical protein M3Y99_01228700 [Aphelenchoides fujianensis]|nr:hypothetical protein M3Y99_01228700 [Aphelenchoides fujianensis]